MTYDVIILGGGVNGLGTARDCAQRGLRVLLLEKGDLASGASGASSGMIHGGPRYMLSDPAVTRLAATDSGFIQRIAPHLLFRVPFLLPFTSRGAAPGPWERAVHYATEAFFGAYDKFQPLKRGQPSARLTAAELYALEPGLRAAGLLSLVGGKLASYRVQAEEATDRILALLGHPPVPCRTHQVALPGGEAVPDVAALAARHQVAAPVVARVAYRHGARAEAVLRLCDEDPRLRLVVCRDAGLLAAEVVHCLRHELVRRLRDLRSRCKLAVCGCGGLDCARLAAQLAGRELGWSPGQVRAELADLLEVGWRERRVVLDGAQLQQEELLRGAHWGVGR